ncbi:MAG: TrmJ/YjtD family RNA methyltransferase [Candidatus Lokiarchaeota archaeon]|nr:TrmJ/YjtD family RNA methyltransferase [Candidatus Lokiarchaeota archaeon]
MKKKKIIRKNMDKSTSSIKNQFENLQFYFTLVEPSGSANVGAVARSLKNFGFKELILFNPKCTIDSDARKYSMHAREDVLEKAQIIHLEDNISEDMYLHDLKTFFKDFDYVIGTSGKQSMFRNLRRITYYVDDLDFSNMLLDKKCKINLVFGRESTGLYNNELSLCDFVIRIPTADEYSSINLAHAVTIVCFTLFKKLREITRGTILPSTKKQREILYQKIDEVINRLDFNKDVDRKIIRAFKNILGRSFSSMKEISLLMSLFDQVNNREKVIASKYGAI